MQTPCAVTKNPMIRLLITWLPARMKRIVFLASLTAIAKETNVPEEHLISKLNAVLNLSTTGDAALKLPIHISQLIWADKTVFTADIRTLTHCEGSELDAVKSAEHIATAVPAWFKYGEKTDLVKDIVSLFKADSCIFPNQPLAG